jgi:putative ABC transport system permease protein
MITFRSSLRALWKQKVFTLINILGLSIGISTALVIYLIVQYDEGFDRFEPDRDRIYRVITRFDEGANSGVAVPAYPAMQQMTGLDKVVPWFGFNEWSAFVSIPSKGNQAPRVFKKQGDKIVLTTGDYFDLFPHQWLAGQAGSSLKEPYQVVLAQSKADLYFPGVPYTDVVGRVLNIDDTLPVVVSGVVKDLTHSSDFERSFFLSVATITAHKGMKQNYQWDQWGNTNGNWMVLVKLSRGSDTASINKQLQALFLLHNGNQDNWKRVLQPLSAIHFDEATGGAASRSTLVSLSLLALFILLLGAINFVNLSTAQAMKRAKEVGMRKILGSSRWALILQFLKETYLITTLSTLFSLVLVPFILSLFKDFLPEGLGFHNMWQPQLFVFIPLLILVVGALAGFYPALVQTGFDPLSVTKNQPVSLTGSTRGTYLRKGLTVFQFITAQVFIIGVLVVNAQIRFSVNKEMGFKKDAIINFYVPINFQNPDHKGYVLRDRIRTIPGVESASFANQSPAFSGWMKTEVKYTDGKKEMTIDPDSRSGDQYYIPLYHIDIMAGRDLTPADSATELLINETMARQMGFNQPAEAVGKFLDYSGGLKPIVGVMKDFNLASTRMTIHPLIFSQDRKYGYVMHVALNPNMDTWKSTLASIEKQVKEIYPQQDFDYTFLDNTIKNFYDREMKLSKLLTWSATIAILISCLGLLGLVIFTANQKTKEIGIRKVLGATVYQIVSLLSKDFMVLLGLAFVIAVPIGWYFMHKYLQDYAYHISLSWWLFALSGLLMMVIALAILIVRARAAAMANPVKSLRTE